METKAARSLTELAETLIETNTYEEKLQLIKISGSQNNVSSFRAYSSGSGSGHLGFSGTHDAA